MRVFVFDNRVEIHSPGLLPDGMDVEALKRGTSRPVNEQLFNHAIHLLPYTGVGTGIMRALELESGMVMVNDVELQEFVVTFRRVETGEDNGEVDAKNGEDKPLNVNENGLGNGRDDDRDNGGVARVPYKNLPSQWKNVIQYCTIPKSAREIIAHLGYQYHSKYIAEIIRPLVKMNYLEMMVPDKPNSKNQKYRKVEK